MTVAEARELMAGRYGPEAVASADRRRTGRDLVLTMEPMQVRSAAELMLEAGFFLEFITAVERGEALELVYMWGRQDGGPRVEARAAAGRAQEAPSLARLVPAADWQEREVWDMFGRRFAGHPNLTRLLLTEDADFHPLLHSFRPGPEQSGDHVETEPV